MLCNVHIHMNASSDERFDVTIHHQSKTMDDTEKVASFQIEKNKSYEVCIKQPLAKSNLKPHLILLYVLTCVVQGVLNIIFLNSDSDWYKNIRPYCLKAKFSICCEKDMDIHITYTNAQCGKFNIWSAPCFTIDPPVPAEVQFIPNLQDFKNQYFNYVKKICSIAMVGIILFSLLFFAGLKIENLAATVILLILIAALLMLPIWLAKKEYKRLKKLYQSFLKQQSEV